MKKSTLFILILLVAIFLVGCQKPKEIKKKTPTGEVKKVEGVTLVLDFGGGKISTYSGIKMAEQTALGVLKKVTSDKKLELEIKEYSFGNLITQIGDKANTKEKAWVYFVNGKSGEVAADKMEVKDGDVIEWKYITPQY